MGFGACEQFPQLAVKRPDLPRCDVLAHDVGRGGDIETVAHPFRVCQPVVGECGVITVERHAQRVQACRARGIPILVAGELHCELHVRERVSGSIRHHRVKVRQRGLRALELRQQVRQLGVRVEQVVGDQHRAFAIRGEQAVVDDALGIRVEIPWHARIVGISRFHTFDGRFGDGHGLIVLTGEQQVAGPRAFPVAFVRQLEGEVRCVGTVDERTGDA